MGRIENHLTDLPPHMQAVFLRQFAREAEAMAHQAADPERKATNARLAAQWRAMAEELDAAELEATSEAYEFGGSSARTGASPSS